MNVKVTGDVMIAYYSSVFSEGEGSQISRSAFEFLKKGSPIDFRRWRTIYERLLFC